MLSLKLAEDSPGKGSLHLPFLLPGMLFLQEASWLHPSHPLGLSLLQYPLIKGMFPDHLICNSKLHSHLITLSLPTHLA